MFLKNKKILSKQEIYRTAVFGALWAVFETSLGTLLHISKVPFRGIALSLIAVVLLAASKMIIDYKGSLLMLGLICASAKTAVAGAFMLNPVVAVVVESLLAEAAFSIFTKKSMASIAAGAAVLLYTFIHSVSAQFFFFGFEIIKVYDSIFSKIFGSADFGISAVYLIFAAYALLHFILGAAAGFIGYRLGYKTLLLLGTKSETA